MISIKDYRLMMDVDCGNACAHVRFTPWWIECTCVHVRFTSFRSECSCDEYYLLKSWWNSLWAQVEMPLVMLLSFPFSFIAHRIFFLFYFFFSFIFFFFPFFSPLFFSSVKLSVLPFRLLVFLTFYSLDFILLFYLIFSSSILSLCRCFEDIVFFFIASQKPTRVPLQHFFVRFVD